MVEISVTYIIAGSVSVIILVVSYVGITIFFKSKKKLLDKSMTDPDSIEHLKQSLKELEKKEKESKEKTITESKKASMVVSEKTLETERPENIADDKLISEQDLKDNKFYAEVDPYDYLWSYKYKRKWYFLWKQWVKVPHKKRKAVTKHPDKYVKVRFKLMNDRVVEFPVIASLIGFTYKKGKYLFDEQTKYETIQGQQLIPTYDFHETLVLPIKQRIRLVKELSEFLDGYDKTLQKQVFSGKTTDKKKQLKKYSDMLKKAHDFTPDDMVRMRNSFKKDKRILEILENFEDKLKSSQDFIIPTDEIKDILESGNITETENIVNPQTLARYLKADFIQQLVKGALTKLVKIIFWIMIIILLITVIDFVLDIITTTQISGVFEQFQKQEE